MVSLKDTPGFPLYRGLIAHPYALVFLWSWVLSVPWAVHHGPSGLQWVVSQALGAAVLPVAAGWFLVGRSGKLSRGLYGATVGAIIILIAGLTR